MAEIGSEEGVDKRCKSGASAKHQNSAQKNQEQNQGSQPEFFAAAQEGKQIVPEFHGQCQSADVGICRPSAGLGIGIALAKNMPFQDEVVHLCFQKAPVGIFRSANNGLVFDIEAGIDQNGRARAFPEGMEKQP